MPISRPGSPGPGPKPESMARLTYRPLAQDDLDFIYEVIEPHDPRRAFDFVQDIRDRLRRNLLAHPRLGPTRPDLGSGIRIYPIKAKRIVVAYRVGDDEIIIVRVFYGGADYEVVLMRQEDLT